MKFYDKVKITCISGKGGNGAISARREAFMPYGGPAGGNGGRGGHIIFVGAKDENTLLQFRYNRYLAANDGEPGQSKEKYGKNADDKYYKVPLGTTIKEISTGKIIHQFTSDGEEFIAVEGGAGGIGNMHFSNSRNQYPNFCLLGEPAQTREFELELQLLGDVALIGTPSVGKSSIINACSNTKAKVADYPFTTLIPNLGSVKTHNFSYNIIDIPGLIEGASQGKGLGNDFLRHILKAKVFAFVVDASRYEQGISEIPLLREEIMNYISSRFIESTEYGSPIKKISFELSQQKNKILIIIKAHFEDSSEKIILEKVISFIINKIDLLDGDEEIIEEYEKNLTETILTFFKKNYSTKITSKTISQSIEKVSAASYNGIEKLKDFFGHILQEFETLQSIITIEKIAISKKTTHEITDVTADELSTLKEKEYIDENDVPYTKVFRVTDPEVVRLAFIVPRGNDEAELRFRNVMKKQGFIKKLEKYGVRNGDILKIISHYQGVEDRYIKY